MKFEALEAARRKVQNHTTMCEENDRKREEARKMIVDAKSEAHALMDRQIDGEDVIDELARAQARVSVAETKYKRLIQSIGESNPEMSKEGISFYTVQSQIFAYPTQGLPEDMKDELEAMQAAHDAYLKAMEEALVKFYTLRQEADSCLKEAEKIFGRKTAADKASSVALTLNISPSVLRPWGLWWEAEDANNEINVRKQKAMEAVEGVTYIPEARGLFTGATPVTSYKSAAALAAEGGVLMERARELLAEKSK